MNDDEFDVESFSDQYDEYNEYDDDSDEYDYGVTLEDYEREEDEESY